MTPAQILAAIVLAMIISAAGTWQVQDWRYGQRLADQARTRAEAVLEAGRVAREEEQRRQSALNRLGRDARDQNKTASVDASVADAAGDRLHIEAGKFAATACGDPRATERGASATRAAMVLSDLLQRADKRAGELAAAYDRALIAGLACERSFNTMRD